MSTLHQFPEKLAVLKLAAGADVPAWAESSSLFSITASSTMAFHGSRTSHRVVSCESPFLALRTREKHAVSEESR